MSGKPRAPYLTVPEPASRPGEQPDFSYLDIPRAGTVARPPIDVEAHAISDMASQVIRVLNKEGEAVGDWAPDLPDSDLIDGLKDMMTVRAFDVRMMTAQRQGKTSFYMQSLGEEAIACAFQRAIEVGDMNFPTYRQQGLLISGGYPLEDMMNQVYSNSADPLEGRQLPVLYSSDTHGFFSISGNLGTQFVQAVGWAMASAISGDDRIAAGWIGDGATAESDFYSALVFASTYSPPVVLNIVNNQWAISTFSAFAKGNAPTLASRGLGFGIASLCVDGNDFLAVYAAGHWAAQRARAGFGPTLIEYVTYRDGAHSTSDDPSAYRSTDEGEAWPLGDPIERLKTHLIKRGAWSEERHVQAKAEIEETVRAAQKAAEANGTLGSSAPPATDMFRDIYSDIPPILQRQLDGVVAAQREQ